MRKRLLAGWMLLIQLPAGCAATVYGVPKEQWKGWE
jgi:hypothetical protein